MQTGYFVTCFWLAISLLLHGCGGQSGSVPSEVSAVETTIPTSSENLAIPDNSSVNDFKILLFGNSHIAKQQSLIASLLLAADPNITVYSESFGGGYLSDNLNNAAAVAKLANNPWTHVILQGQKYSQSGITSYSTDAAKTWIANAKAKGVTPILFPEHPQRGNATEAQRVHDLHASISAKQSSCVAPVGLVWDYVLSQQPSLILHADDGNHANDIGSLLTAMVFYETITGKPAELLPSIESSSASAELQTKLGKWVTFTLASHPPCQ